MKKLKLYEIVENNADTNLYTHPHGKDRGAGYIGYECEGGDIAVFPYGHADIDAFDIVPWEDVQQLQKTTSSYDETQKRIVKQIQQSARAIGIDDPFAFRRQFNQWCEENAEGGEEKNH